MISTGAQTPSRREWLAVAVMTAIGFGLRSWPIGRLGLNHFDEGIYAMAATWSLLPKGLAAIDPSLIPYAPPGYPILGGLAYWVLGRSDGAMIAVSQIAGTMTIPVVAWLASRAFGPGAGFASATFCAFSGPHIAFSRMALTDASFLLAWLLAIGAGMRFLERPGLVRAIMMGLAVGLAQQFKYNGWLAGGIVIGSATLGILVRPEERRASSILKTFGWGGVAAGVAWLVVWPWYAFVEAHGGYSALLRHQQSYLGGFHDWWPNLLVQADQAAAMSGGNRLIVPGLLIAGSTPWVARPWPWREATVPIRALGLFLLIFLFGFGPWLLVGAPYWLGLVILPWLLTWPRSTVRLMGVWWLVLSVVTPFYHPYSRLWLPYQAINWIFMGSLVAIGPGLYASSILWIGSSAPRRRSFRLALAAMLGLFALGGMVALPGMIDGRGSSLPGLFTPSDSLYRAAVRVSERLPDEVKAIRLMARPSVSYYLARRVTISTVAKSDQLLKRGDPNAWALVDSTIFRSESGGTSSGSGRNLLDRFADNWEVVEEIPTNPSLPTLLDLDPGLARSDSGDRSYPIWLLRPRTSKAPR